jgi:hypothetical protein
LLGGLGDILVQIKEYSIACYRYFENNDYPVFTVMNSITKYSGQAEVDLYYIESDSYISLHDNG